MCSSDLEDFASNPPNSFATGRDTPEFYFSIFSSVFFKLNYLFIYLFLAVLGLHCSAQVSSSCGERGLIFVAVRGLLIEVASLLAEHSL